MSTTSTDRMGGVSSSAAIKNPVLAATTAAITLSGLQTVDGVSLAAGDRVLVKDQATGADNGIYVASSSAWTRTKDFDGVRDVTSGTIIICSAGTTNGGMIYRLSTTGDITIGTTSLTFTDALAIGSGDITADMLSTAALSTANALNKIYYVPAGTTQVVNIPSDCATLAAAQTAIAGWKIGATATVQINVTGHIDCGTSICTWDHPDAARIKIRGAAPLTKTLSGAITTSGSRGNWDITYTLDSVTGISVGDILCMRDFPQSFPTQGGQTSPVVGGCAYGLSNSAILNVLVTVSSGSPTKVDFSASISGLVTVGSIIVILGQVRRVDSIDSTTRVTVNTAFTQSVASLNYWLLLAPEAGTVTITSGNATGSGTSFLSRVSAGDIIVCADGNNIAARINSVTNDTTLATDRTFSASAGTYFAIINAIGWHEGAFRVTALPGGNTVTVKNYGLSEWAPSTKGISGGTVKVITSTLYASGNGITVNAPKLDIDDVALLGTARAGSGITANGATGNSIASITLGDHTPVLEWSYGAAIYNGSNLYARTAFLCGNSYAGLDIARATADLDTAITAGNTNYGVVADCGGIRGSRLHSNTNGTAGVRLQVGGFVYSDWSSFFGNAEVHVLAENDSGVQFVGATMLLGGRSGNTTVVGFDGQNGGKGRLTGLVAIGNYGGTVVSGSGTAAFEVGEATILANAGTAIAASGGAIIQAPKLGAVSNTSIGIDTSEGGMVISRQSFVSNNSAGGVRANNGGSVQCPYMASLSNSGFDFSAPTGGNGNIWCYGYVGAPSFAQTINTFTFGMSYITDGTAKVT